MLSELFNIQNRYLAAIPTNFKRYLYDEINWDNRLNIITGARGTGKTTLVLQHFREKYGDIKKCLYFSADNPLVLKNGIYNTAAEYFKFHGDCLIIDEVHKQKDWSIEVKGLYDAYPDKKFIILGSSTLNILSEKSDLSRRGVIYSLQPLSFREFLVMKFNKQLPAYSFEDILSGHIDIAGELSAKFAAILGDFNDYLMFGSHPFFAEYSRDEYFKVLANVIDKMIYEDITTIRTLKAFSSLKLKKLLGFLACSKVPLFNLETLKNEIDVSRDTLYEYFDLLARAELLNIVSTESKKPKAFKNSKILFKSPNVYYSIAFELWNSDIQKGNIRESFFAAQVGKDYQVFSSMNTDFLVTHKDRRIEIEVGGKSKRRKQIK
ncbi:MAG: ATP-binding protein, partial [bacterium]|nr:ATP-binding protein [bacterium]